MLGLDYEPIDLIRVMIFAGFGLGVALMLVVNVLAFRVLRPPAKVGFLWWHVSGISVSFLCLGTVALERVVGRLGAPATWRTVVTFIGVAAFLASQIIIFGVERERMIVREAKRKAALELDGDELDGDVL